MKERRGARLAGPEKTLFSGEYWTGSKAVELGIADGIGDLRSVLRERFGDKVVTPLVSPARGWFGRAQPGVGVAGLDGLLRRPDFAEEVISALEARALWARYGLVKPFATSRRSSMPPVRHLTARQDCARRARRCRGHRVGRSRKCAESMTELERVRAASAVDPVTRQALPTLRRDPHTGEWRVM